jgi:hypothetical protein
VMSNRVIWQYWETVGEKPKYIDGLHRLVQRNSGVASIVVTPDSLQDYVPDLPPLVHQIGEVAIRASMIRSMLIRRYGGMWLDSDAIVLQDLNWLFDHLEEYEFVGFNENGRLHSNSKQHLVRVNCFLSRANGTVVSEWVKRQHAKFPKTDYVWGEIGASLLHPVCLDNPSRVKILPFEWICPIRWDEVEKFTQREVAIKPILRKCCIVMLSNNSIGKRQPKLQERTVEEIAGGDYLLSAIMRYALDRPEPNPSLIQRLIQSIRPKTV